MGFSGNGASSLKYNHGMLSQRGTTFKKKIKYINVKIDPVPVDEARMSRIAAKVNRSATIKLVGVIATVFFVYILVTLLFS